MVDSFRAIAMIGVVGGIVFIAIGIFLLTGYQKEFNFYYGIFSTAFGAMCFWKGIQVFLPVKQQTKRTEAGACPYCGAILQEDATVCPKCNRTLDQANAREAPG